MGEAWEVAAGSSSCCCRPLFWGQSGGGTRQERKERKANVVYIYIERYKLQSGSDCVLSLFINLVYIQKFNTWNSKTDSEKRKKPTCKLQQIRGAYPLVTMHVTCNESLTLVIKPALFLLLLSLTLSPLPLLIAPHLPLLVSWQVPPKITILK